MVESRKIVKIFLASPGDLQDERNAAKSVVDEFNNTWAEFLGYHVDLVGWEDTVTIYGRPQATINRDLERCEYFIGMLWRRWGTPPDNSGPYTSGFEEEFRASERNRQKEGSPEISLFLKTISADQQRDPGDELKKVLAFKNEIVAKKLILFETFENVADFQEKIRRCITRYIQKLRAEETRERTQEGKARSSADSAPESPSGTASTSESLLSEEGANFLRDLISKTEQPAEQERITPSEVARFRLLASMIGKPENDEKVLGVHDANLLYIHRSDFVLSRTEQIGMIDYGFAHFLSENTPLWYWIAQADAHNQSWLQLCTIYGTTAERIGAISAMRLLSMPLSSEFEWGKDACIESWFSDAAPSSLKKAALSYLSDCGTTADLTTIKAELDRKDYQTTGPAVDAILHINFRDSCENAILALYDLQPESINSRLLTSLFEKGASISTDILSRGIKHRCSDVRHIIVKLLRKRKALEVEDANLLTSDSDAGVRFEALLSLAVRGRRFSADEAKKILIKPNPNPLSALTGSFGAIDRKGEAYWKRFRECQLAAMADQELEQAAKDELFYGGEPQFVLIDRRFTKFGSGLRAAVDSQFKTEFAEKLNRMVQVYGRESDIVEKLKPLEEYLRKEATRKGLDIICRKGGSEDLSRVRKVLKSGFVEYTGVDIEYLRKYGEWGDVPLIIAALDQPPSGRTGLLSAASDDSKFQVAARAICGLGQTRFEELLSLPMPTRLLPFLIAESSKKVFRALNDRSIIRLFRSEHDTIRKAATLKCIEVLPKGRLVQLLSDYVSGDKNQFYNVIHWLDFGVSVPRDSARSAAGTVLAREWRA